MARAGAADTARAFSYAGVCAAFGAASDTVLASSWTPSLSSMAVAGMSQRPSNWTARSVPRLIRLRTPDSDMPTISATSRGRYATRLSGLCMCFSSNGANSFRIAECCRHGGDPAAFAVYDENGKPAEADQPVRKYGHHRSTGRRELGGDGGRCPAPLLRLS